MHSPTSHTQQPPAWLKRHLDDAHPPPKLFAWTPANLDGAEHGTGGHGHGREPAGGDDLDRRIFILGIGNIGRLYASHLARNPPATRPPITLVVHRKELLSQWAAGSGIELVTLGAAGRRSVCDKDAFNVEWWTETAPSHGPVREVVDGRKLRSLVIATKASAAVPEADRLRRYLDAQSSVAFAQNGVCKLWPPHGPAYVAHRYPAAGSAPSFLACVTSHGLYSLGPFRSVHAAAADVSVGPVPVHLGHNHAAYLMRQIASAPQLQGRAVSSAELWLLQLEKLVYNSSINPLTALLRCKNGGLFEEPGGVVARVMDRLLDETSHVLQALVVHESAAEILAAITPDEHHNRQQQQQLQARFAQPRLREMLHAFGAKVAENTSSMLQDVLAGKPTEVRDFNGWLIDAAAFLDPGLDMSAHQAMVDLVESGIVLTKEELGRRLL
ncbi:ketopantoate reductase panE/ApbA domain-containing protein [Hirsutella rhossiliensis]|uniref:Ketopantoate reductase panE/ApbA domain-containing protein n=1 Tax=Hirsutella rhossiliensis TaxID=111463 RepID=A0A9P8MRR4_9HYPO|nr:ketopantoate reductase panE/ApbA domain-containing protein [Hirsutella rhossiliensis]KAH0960015.1 ketopantoate reductase panE/ApbA domain-containing protein [Hirsutella rhossiliensis]